MYIYIEMQGQEKSKANILGLESNLSNEAAELLLDEDAQLVRYSALFLGESRGLIKRLQKKGIYRVATGGY